MHIPELLEGYMFIRNRILVLAVLASAASVQGCSDSTFDIPNPNSPELTDLQRNPTAPAIIDATQGLLVGARAGISAQSGYIPQTGILGRESYTLDNSDPRYVDQIVGGDLNPGDGAFGGSGWTPRYANIRLGNVVLNALDNPSLTGFTNAQKEAIRGFVKTMQALDYLLIINLRDTNGAVVDVNVAVGEIPGPIVGKDAVFDHIVKLLDEAQAHLNAGGNSFPFRLSEGFQGFNTPLTFLQFNRALRARVAVYRKNYPQALTALGNSFLNPSAPLTLGVYYTFGTGGGDVTNGIAASPNIFAHPSIRSGAQTQPGGATDARIAAKTAPLATPLSRQGITTNVAQRVYVDLTTPIPIVRNEELILLRAEARWFTGNREGALADLNLIRQRSGGLAPIAMPATDEVFITALLRERESSLFLEGHRWIDYRRFGRLNQLPLARPTDRVPNAFPIPRNECLARNLTVPCSV